MDINELTITWKDDEGRQIIKELGKEILTKGAWATIMYLYQTMDKATGEYSEPQVRIVRYKKNKDSYFAHSKFNISGRKQSYQIMEQLKKWYPE